MIYEVVKDHLVEWQQKRIVLKQGDIVAAEANVGEMARYKLSGRRRVVVEAEIIEMVQAAAPEVLVEFEQKEKSKPSSKVKES